MRRRIAAIVLGLAVAAAIAVSGGWLFFAQQTRRAIVLWADAQRQNGVDVTWQDLKFGGFPLRIDARFAGAKFSLRQTSQNASWQPEFLALFFSSLSPQAIDFASPGAHDIDIASDALTWSAHIAAKTFDGQAIFPPQDYRRIQRLRGRLAGLRVTPADWRVPLTVGRGSFEATLPAARPVAPQAVHPVGAALDVDLVLRDIGLPQRLVDGSAFRSLGPTIDTFAADAAIMGELNPTTADSAALAAWRDSGGTVELTSIDLRWGPVLISADGTLALDDDLQPVGAFATRIAGLEQFITALESAGVLTSSDASVARITLAVLTRASDDGGPDRAVIPITLQQRTLRLGPIALLQMPMIEWD